MQNITFVSKISLKQVSNRETDRIDPLTTQLVYQLDHVSQDYIPLIKDMYWKAVLKTQTVK